MSSIKICGWYCASTQPHAEMIAAAWKPRSMTLSRQDRNVEKGLEGREGQSLRFQV